MSVYPGYQTMSLSLRRPVLAVLDRWRVRAKRVRSPCLASAGILCLEPQIVCLSVHELCISMNIPNTTAEVP